MGSAASSHAAHTRMCGVSASHMCSTAWCGQDGPYCYNCRRAWAALHCAHTQECVGCQKVMHVFCCMVSYAYSHTLHTCAPGYNAGVAFAFALVLVDMQHRLRFVWAVTISQKVSLPFNLLYQIPNPLPNMYTVDRPKKGQPVLHLDEDKCKCKINPEFLKNSALYISGTK